MGGFKEGSVSGWDTEGTDGEGETEDKPHDDTSSSSTADPERSLDSAESASTNDTAPSTTEDGPSDAAADGNDIEPADIPWILRRSNITDGREQTVQLHLRKSTLELQRERKTEIESELGESVRKADLREAALLVGLQEMDEVTAVLREWGYELG